MQPVLHKLSVNGVELAYFERGMRRLDAASILFVHATGFHGRIWDYHAEALADHHSIALELRGHGRSSRVAVTDWRTFGEDLAAFVISLDLAGIVGVGHSMGAHTMIDGAASSGAFSRLILLDPTVFSPQDYASDAQPFSAGEGLHPAARRKGSFTSPDEMHARLSSKSAFPLYHPRIFRDYCEHGLEYVEPGMYRLACAPETEARIYMSSRTNGAVYDSIRALDIPVTIVRARESEPGVGIDFSSSPTWPGLADEFPDARDIHWPDCSHFIPMQRPDDVVAIIREELARSEGV